MPPRSDSPVPVTAKRSDPPRQPQPLDRLDRTQAGAILERIKSKYLESLKGTSQFYASRFEAEADRGLRELRLLCLASPERALELLSAMAENASLGIPERVFAVQGLGFLAAKGARGAEDSLYRLAASIHAGAPDAEVANIALSGLSLADPDGRYLSLYREKCREGLGQAFRAVQVWNDPETTALMEELKEAGMGQQGELYVRGLGASQVLEKRRILADSGGENQIRAILEDPMMNGEATLWALRVATLNSYPGLAGLLRNRLRQVERDIEKTLGAIYDGVPSGHPTPDAEISRSPHPRGLNDPHFDDILVAYAELGGTCTGPEVQRLREFGYLGDPNERLGQLMKDDR